MNNASSGEMEKAFAPLWADLCDVSSQFLVCGGYGLFLKQQYLQTQLHALAIIVNLDRWQNAAPRVTKDIDLIVNIDVIANAEDSKFLATALENREFKATAQNPRWQFDKSLPNGQNLIIEFHCCPPLAEMEGVKIVGDRVKHKPSLGEEGVHGHTNPEAVGSDLHPFAFDMNGLILRVPNPLTWCVMKLTAMDDRWQKANDLATTSETQQSSRSQAIKHAQDVCRIVALTTREESDKVKDVQQSIYQTEAFKRACQIAENLRDENSPLVLLLQQQWMTEDFETIRSTLNEWF